MTNNDFTNKMKCYQLRDDIMKKVEKEFEGTGAKIFIDELFYSKKRESCIYGVTKVYNNDKGELVRRTHNIADQITGEELYSSCASALGDEDEFVKVWQEYKNKLEELK